MQRLDALPEILGPDWVAALGSDMTQTAFKFLAGWANPHQVKRLGRARLARWFQRETRKAWGERRADAVVSAAEATLALWGPTGLDYEAWPPTSPPKPASPSSSHARSPASMSGSSTTTATPTPTTSCCRSPVSARSSPVRSAADSGTPPVHQPGRGPVLLRAHPAPALLRAHRRRRRPTKHGDACLREALFLAADHARKTDPTPAARYQRLMCQTGRHHTSALCTIATVLCTRIVACLRNDTPYQVRDVDGSPITPAQGRAIVAERYQIPPDVRAARRTISNTRPRHRRGDERIEQGVAKRSTMTPVPPASLTPAASLDNH